VQTLPVPSPSQRRWAQAKVSRGEYARRRRIALLALLAPDARCAECGEPYPIDELEVDHVDGCTWRKQELSPWSRVARYWREYKLNVPLRALCRSCNARDARRFRGRRRYA
jgi:hypothetical protein